MKRKNSLITPIIFAAPLAYVGFDRLIGGITSNIPLLPLISIALGSFVITYLLQHIQKKYNNPKTFIAYHIFLTTILSLAFLALGEIIAKIINFLGYAKEYFLEISLIVGICIYGWALFAGNTIINKKKKIYSSKIKKALRIIQISDTHLHGPYVSKRVDKIMRKSMKENPDLMVITGDFIDKPGLPNETMFDAMKKAKIPIYYVSGNHEIDYIGKERTKKLINKIGLKYLSNESILSNGIMITGIEDDASNKQIKDLVKKKTNKFHLYLIHKPLRLDLVKNKVDMTLSGHVHAGQIFPGKQIARGFFKFVYGWYNYGNTKVYVSPGTRSGEMYIRLGSRNEITVIDLLPK